MRSYLILWLLISSVTACKPEEKPLPISEEKLIVVLTDVHLAEAGLQNLRGDTRDSIANLYYEQIYAIHGIEKGSFDETMAMLREDPVRLERIYRQVMERLQKQQLENKN